MTKYFFSLQYSAIQKTILRHDRLWSMAGISSILSELNEIILPEITKQHGGEVLVAGGGKFTACFPDKDKEIIDNAAKAKEEIIKKVSTTLPMLEFQVSSEIVPAENLSKAKEAEKDENPDSPDGKKFEGLVGELNEQKRAFRGYGITFNPHFERCEECHEYPAAEERYYTDEDNKKKTEKERLCSICFKAKQKAKVKFKDIIKPFQWRQDEDESESTQSSKSQHYTTIQKIYLKYYEIVGKKDAESFFALENIEIPYNFEHLFTSKHSSEKQQDKANIKNEEQDKKRMAVWFSDINNMNSKVPIWLAQEDDKIFGIFDAVKSVFIDITANALAKTFCNLSPDYIYLPFRIVVAGGDDLCVVMDAKYILDFTLNISEALHDKRNGIAEDKTGKPHSDNDNKERENYLSFKWLNEKFQQYKESASDDRKKEMQPRDKKIKPYSFGASFVISDIHTPFKKIHEIGEELMSKAKKDTDRWDNSINWAVMADENTLSSQILKFEKPLYIEETNSIELNSETDKAEWQEKNWNKLSFREYIDFCKKYSGISSSHLQQIVKKAIELKNDANALERWLKVLDSEEADKSFSDILTEECLRGGDDKHLMIERVMTMFELLSIKGSVKNNGR